MKRRAVAFAALLTSLPSAAFAQAVPSHWSARYAGPILLAGVVVLLAIGLGLAFRGWNRLGVVLWMMVMTAGGTLVVYSMQGAILGKVWQLPSMLGGVIVFVLTGQWALNRLNRVDAGSR